MGQMIERYEARAAELKVKLKETGARLKELGHALADAEKKPGSEAVVFDLHQKGMAMESDLRGLAGQLEQVDATLKELRGQEKKALQERLKKLG